MKKKKSLLNTDEDTLSMEIKLDYVIYFLEAIWCPSGLRGPMEGMVVPVGGTWDERQVRWIEKKRNKNAILACASSPVPPETLRQKTGGASSLWFFVFVRDN